MQLTYLMMIGGMLTTGAGFAAPPQLTGAAPQTQSVPAPQLPLVETVAPPPPLTEADIRRRRDAITLMEGVLAAAVRLGAAATAQELQAVQPGITLFTTSAAKARGIYLAGYGVVFQVEIPGVRPSVVSMMETIARDRSNRENQGAVPASAGGALPSVMTDPDATYRNSVTDALVDAMLDYTKALTLRADEWLAVAARGDDMPLMAGEIFESRPMVLRVRGADLAEFLAGRLTRAEVRRRVQVGEF